MAVATMRAQRRAGHTRLTPWDAIPQPRLAAIGHSCAAALPALRAARDAEPDSHTRQFMTEVVGRLEATAVDAS